MSTAIWIATALACCAWAVFVAREIRALDQPADIKGKQ